MRHVITTLTLAAMAALAACHTARETTRPTTPEAPPQEPPPADQHEETDDVTSGDASPTEDATANAEAPLERQAMTDEAFGQLVVALSEDTGDFPSDNLVSNETSYLDVVETLLAPSRRGRAYVGVGPEQNLTYIAMMEPRMAYIIDIRRENMLEHMMLRAMIEASETRAAFLERLTSRQPPPIETTAGEPPSLDDLMTRVAVTRPQPELVKQGVDDTVELMKRLGVPLQKGDRASIENVVQAFAKKGVDISYTMERSKRRYPKLREILTATDPSGTPRSFLATEESYSVVRSLLKANRVVPVVGDFCGERALKGIADDVRARGLELGVFYTSNVEQYLFKAHCYDRFVDNVKAFPIDGESVFIRVWFDQGRSHPKQRPHHRTTTVVMPVETSLSRWDAGAYRNYWRVVIDEP